MYHAAVMLRAYDSRKLMSGRMNMRGKRALAGLLAVLVPGAGFAVAFSPGINTPPDLPGTVAYVSKGTITTTSTPSGAVQENTQLSLDFQASGVVNHLYVTPGQHVKSGQLLATISDPTLQNAVANDQMALRVAQANLAKTLAPPTQAAIDGAQANVDRTL